MYINEKGVAIQYRQKKFEYFFCVKLESCFYIKSIIFDDCLLTLISFAVYWTKNKINEVQNTSTLMYMMKIENGLPKLIHIYAACSSHHREFVTRSLIGFKFELNWPEDILSLLLFFFLIFRSILLFIVRWPTFVERLFFHILRVYLLEYIEFKPTTETHCMTNINWINRNSIAQIHKTTKFDAVNFSTNSQFMHTQNSNINWFSW